MLAYTEYLLFRSSLVYFRPSQHDDKTRCTTITFVMADKLKNSQNRVKLLICLFDSVLQYSWDFARVGTHDLQVSRRTFRANGAGYITFRNMHCFLVICPLLKHGVV